MDTATKPDVLKSLRGSKEIWTISNAISLVRVILIFPAIFALVFHFYPLAAAIFGVAYLTDLLDGYIARKTNDISEFGKIIDPLADKLFVGAVVLTMMILGLLPVWFVLAIVARDLIILAGGIWASKKLKVVLPSNYTGKAAVLVIALTLFLVALGVSGSVLVFMEVLSLLLMLVSLTAYIIRLTKLLKLGAAAE